jgi:hypothetical protein
VKRSVEAGDRRNTGEQAARGIDGGKRRRQVDRGEINESSEALAHLVVQHHRLAERGAAMDDPMAASIDRSSTLDEPLDRLPTRLQAQRPT